MGRKGAKRCGKGGGRPGRKSVESGEDPLIEARLKIVADLWAGRRSRSQIIAHFAEKNAEEVKRAKGDVSKASKLYAVESRMIENYISEVKRRWKEESATEEILEKKHRLIRGYERTILIAEGKVKFIKELHKFVPAPETFAMIQGLESIGRLEGLAAQGEPNDNDLDSILDKLARERIERNKKGDS